MKKISYAVLFALITSFFLPMQAYAQGDESAPSQNQPQSNPQGNNVFVFNEPQHPNNQLTSNQIPNQPQAQTHNQAQTPNQSQPRSQPNTQSQTGGQPQNADLNSRRQAFVDKINEYRATIGLPALQRWTSGESCADNSSRQDAQANAAHGSMGSCGEMAQNTCPNFPSMDSAYSDCLQSMWNEGPPPSEPCTGDCYQKHGHYINMASRNYTRVAVGFYQLPNGNVWVNMNFR